MVYAALVSLYWMARYFVQKYQEMRRHRDRMVSKADATTVQSPNTKNEERAKSPNYPYTSLDYWLQSTISDVPV